MFFEVYKQGNLIIRGKQILNTISLENELMLAPSTTLVLPIDWLDVIDGREEIKIYLDTYQTSGSALNLMVAPETYVNCVRIE